MSLVLKAVYRIANKSEVCFIQGKQIGNDLTKGFVFNDFEKQKSFGISPDEFKSGTLQKIMLFCGLSKVSVIHGAAGECDVSEKRKTAESDFGPCA